MKRGYNEITNSRLWYYLIEIPDHITLFFEMGECTAQCKGCHSPELWNNVELKWTEEEVLNIAKGYKKYGANAVVLMGGTTNGVPKKVLKDIVVKLGNIYNGNIGLYSGVQGIIPHEYLIDSLRWLKVGPYDESKGGLSNSLTNQVFYEIINKVPVDKTQLFRRNVNV